MPSEMPKAQDIIDEFNDESIAVAAAFSTPDGKKAMKLLEELFCNRSSIVRGDPYQTHANEGAREVILTIKEIINHANK